MTTPEEIEVARRNLLAELKAAVRAEELGSSHSVVLAASTGRDLIEVLEALKPAATQPSPGRWWICTNWLQAHDETQKPGIKAAGPFRDQEEALENRARVEQYTRGRTFFVDEDTQ